MISFIHKHSEVNTCLNKTGFATYFFLFAFSILLLEFCCWKKTQKNLLIMPKHIHSEGVNTSSQHILHFCLLLFNRKIDGFFIWKQSSLNVWMLLAYPFLSAQFKERQQFYLLTPSFTYQFVQFAIGQVVQVLYTDNLVRPLLSGYDTIDVFIFLGQSSCTANYNNMYWNIAFLSYIS